MTEKERGVGEITYSGFKKNPSLSHAPFASHARLSLGTQPTLGFQTVAISMVMKALQGGFGRPLLSEEVRCLHLLLGRVYLRHESCNLSEREIMRASSSSISSRSDAFRLSRGTSPRRNPFPLEPFRRPMHRVLGVSSGGGGVLRSEVPM